MFPIHRSSLGVEKLEGRDTPARFGLGDAWDVVTGVVAPDTAQAPNYCEYRDSRGATRSAACITPSDDAPRRPADHSAPLSPLTGRGSVLRSR